MVRDDLIMVAVAVNGHNTFWYLYNYKNRVLLPIVSNVRILLIFVKDYNSVKCNDFLSVPYSDTCVMFKHTQSQALEGERPFDWSLKVSSNRTQNDVC